MPSRSTLGPQRLDRCHKLMLSMGNPPQIITETIAAINLNMAIKAASIAAFSRVSVRLPVAASHPLPTTRIGRWTTPQSTIKRCRPSRTIWKRSSRTWNVPKKSSIYSRTTRVTKANVIYNHLLSAETQVRSTRPASSSNFKSIKLTVSITILGSQGAASTVCKTATLTSVYPHGRWAKALITYLDLVLPWTHRGSREAISMISLSIASQQVPIKRVRIRCRVGLSCYKTNIRK